MPIISSAAQSVEVSSKITVTYAAGEYFRTSNTGTGSVTCSVSVPAGSIIHSSNFSCSTSGGTLYGGTTKINGVTVTGSGPHYVGNGTSLSITVSFSFKSYASDGGSGTTPQSNYTQTRTFSDCVLTVDYSPYSACTPPSSVSVSPSSTGKSKTASLSWSGAGGGTNNDITGYDVYYSTTSSTSGFALLSSPTASPVNVTSSATNGGQIYYKVVAKGAAGASYYSDMSSAVATLTSTWTDATAPNSVTGPTNVVMSTTQRISWSGASSGTNNPIIRYELYHNADNYAQKIGETTGTYLDVTSHAVNGSSYIYKVLVVAEQNTAFSSASHTMTSLVGAITPPSSITFDANNLPPSGQTAIRWSGQSGGVNNAILSYDVQSSPDNSTWSLVSNTTNSAYSPAISSANNNVTVYYRIKLKGERIDAYSSSIGLVTTVTKPRPPSAISINDDNLPVGWSTNKTLSWSGASAGDYNNAIYGYRVMVSQNGGALVQYGEDLITSNSYGSTTIASLPTNGTQTFYVYTIGTTTIAAEKLSALSSAYKILTTTVTNPTAPTASIPTNVAPGSTQSLSWSGAVDGTNNAITTYRIYEKVDSGSWVSAGSDATSPFTVTAHASNGGTKSYYIIADGPHGDSPASATVVMTTTVSKPTAPTTVSLSGTSNLAPNADVTLSWSGAANGEYNNPVNGYRVMRSIDTGAYTQLEADLPKTTTSLVVKTKNGNGTHSFRVIALGTNLGVHSDMSSKIATATTVVSTPSPPSVVEVINGGGVAPQAVRLLRWSGAAAGTYNNPIKGYQVYRSTSATTGYTAFGSPILDPDTYYEMNVEAPTSDGAAYYYKVATLGSTLSINSDMSSVYGTLTTQKLPSTGTLNKSSLTATGSESITVTISPQLTTYTHKVTWYINGTYTSGVITKSAGTTTDTYTVPQSWILATTTTTTSVAAKCRVETFDGATSIGVNEYNFTVTVPGMSSFVLTGVPLTATGSASATATITPTYSGYKHTVVWSTPGYSQTHNVAAGATTQAYIIPKDWCNSAPNAETFTITVTVTTIKVAGGGDMVLGSVSNSFVANIPSDIVPSITSFTKIGIDQNWSLYVRTKSKVKWTPVAVGSYSSTIVSYKIENINLNSGVLAYSAGTSWTSGILNYSGEQTFTLIVTDSRGRTASRVESITVTNYNPPAIASASFVRSNALGQINRTAGVYINLTASFTYSNIGTNAISAKAYYKEVGSGTWLPASGVAVSLTGTGPNMLGSVTYGSAAIDIAKVYDVKVAVSDEYNSPIELATIVPTVTRVFDFREGKAAFGGVAANLKELMLPSDWKIRVGMNEVLHIGNYSDTVAAKVHTHTKASITDFPTSMPASDVSAWAKAATKPTYTPAEVGAAPASHGTHVTYATAAPLIAGTAAVGTSSKVAREDHIHPVQTSVTGNAGTATKLATTRVLTIGSGAKNFDGSASISWTLAEIGALPTSGGSLGASSLITWPGGAPSGSVSTPMQIGYGLIGCYGTLSINANTDNSGAEYLVLTAGQGITTSTTAGVAIGTDTFTWKGTAVSVSGHTHTKANITDFPSSAAEIGAANAHGRIVTDFNHANFRVSGMYGEESVAANGPGYSYKSLLVASNSDVGLQITGGYQSDNLWFRGWHTSGAWYSPWRTILHSGNWSSYINSTTLAGGTWGINITGNAGSVGGVGINNIVTNTGWINDLNSPTISTGFASGNFAHYGPFLTFGVGANYGAQFNSTYGGGTPALSFRTYYNEGTFVASSWVRMLHSANFSDYAVPVRGSSNWNDGSVIQNVIGQMSWKRWGNNHTIFDASAGTSPNGTAVSNTDAQYPWGAPNPILMGWNGSNTYGVRVDSARTADTASTSDALGGVAASAYLPKVYSANEAQINRVAGLRHFDGTVSGAIRLNLSSVNTMVHGRITIRSYERSATIWFSGYTYLGAYWHSTWAYGQTSNGERFRVRFNANGLNERYITIGETNYGWSYLVVSVELFTGYGGSIQSVPIDMAGEHYTIQAHFNVGQPAAISATPVEPNFPRDGDVWIKYI